MALHAVDGFVHRRELLALTALQVPAIVVGLLALLAAPLCLSAHSPSPGPDVSESPRQRTAHAHLNALVVLRITVTLVGLRYAHDASVRQFTGARGKPV